MSECPYNCLGEKNRNKTLQILLFFRYAYFLCFFFFFFELILSSDLHFVAFSCLFLLFFPVIMKRLFSKHGFIKQPSLLSYQIFRLAGLAVIAFLPCPPTVIYCSARF